VENSLWVDGPEGGVCSHPRGRDGDAERRGGIEDPLMGPFSTTGTLVGVHVGPMALQKKKEGKNEAVSFGRRRKGRCHRDEGDMKCRQRRGGRGKAWEESGFGGVESV